MMNTSVKLDARLQAVASLVRGGVRVADIGTDHGYLLAHLLHAGSATYGYACDVNEKPLEKAAFTLSGFVKEGRAKVLLCDGLGGLSAGDAQDIVIAGMGGELIWEILSAQDWTRDPNLRFVLQPMTKPERLRRSLYAAGFEILQEKAATWRGHSYTVMQAAYAGEFGEIEDLFAYCGKLLGQADAAAKVYIDKIMILLSKKLNGARQTGDDKAAEHLAWLLQEIERGRSA